MNGRNWTLLGLMVCLVLLFASGALTPRIASAAQTPGDEGTYYCWDRCRTGVGCNTVCYTDSNVLITCNSYSSSCGGADGVVGQHCGDGVCHYDAGLGYENINNCYTDCHPH